MLDLLGSGSAAMAAGKLSALPLAAASGLVSSTGPCMAPRLLAISSWGLRGTRSRWLSGAFIGGLVLTYIGFGASGDLFWKAGRNTSVIYVCLCVALCAGGVARLLRSEVPARCSSVVVPSTAGGAFLLGTAMALVISPCCTPLLFAAAAYASASGNHIYYTLVLGSFALGHVAPLLLYAAGLKRIPHVFANAQIREAVETGGAVLCVGLGLFYGILA